MKYIYNNEKSEHQISAIERRIKLHMNGETVSSMRDNGLIYAKNYGVLITDLRKIAKEFEPDNTLARRLWMLNIRETKIIATLLYQPEKTDMDEALKLISECDNIELVEQLVMNLLRQLSFASEIVKECLKADNQLIKASGFLLTVRCSAKLSNMDADEVKSICITILNNPESSFISHYAAIALAALCRNHPEIAQELHETLSNQEDSNTYELIKQELIFLGYE